MLYHGRPVLIKPYQIVVSERESGEAGTCKCALLLACLPSSAGSIPASVDQGGCMWVHFTWTDSMESYGCVAATALSCIMCGGGGGA